MRWDLLKRPLSWLRGDEAGSDGTEGTLPDGGQVTMSPSADGPEDVETPATPDPSEADEEGFDVDDEVLLDGIGQPVFMVCPGGLIRAWNGGMAELTGVPSEQAMESEDVAGLFYRDGRPSKTLAQHVLDAPESAHLDSEAELEDPTRHLYALEEEIAGADDSQRFVRVTAMPLYEDGEFVGVVQTVQDLTDERRRQEATEALVNEVGDTLEALTQGHLDARASFTDSDAIDPRLLGVVDDVNRMANQLQDVVTRVDDQADQLAVSVEHAVEAAGNIARNVGEQNDLLTEGVSEMQTFSASMEEVAATAEQVDAAAEMARDAATDGLDASEDARTATNEVTDIGEDLVDSVTDLGERMDDIEDVVEVISDVAEQTNLLALNANIEAARAGKDGDGFAVVAEEVKTLADETRQHTEQITTSIEQLQNQTDSTVVAAEQSHQQIAHASDQITDVLQAFEDIATSIDEAADGIAEVSRATDDQAATVEELTSTLEEAREHAEDTEGAADSIVAATDDQTEAIDELEARVRELRAGKAAHTDGGVAAPNDRDRDRDDSGFQFGN